MGYGIDLRERVISFIEKGGSKTKAAKVFEVSRYAIYSWLKKKEKRGTLKDLPAKRGWKKIDPSTLIDYVHKNPDLTLAEYGKHFGATSVAICKTFKRLKITRKKRLPSIKSEMKKSVRHFWSR